MQLLVVLTILLSGVNYSAASACCNLNEVASACRELENNVNLLTCGLELDATTFSIAIGTACSKVYPLTGTPKPTSSGSCSGSNSQEIYDQCMTIQNGLYNCLNSDRLLKAATCTNFKETMDMWDTGDSLLGIKKK